VFLNHYGLAFGSCTEDHSQDYESLLSLIILFLCEYFLVGFLFKPENKNKKQTKAEARAHGGKVQCSHKELTEKLALHPLEPESPCTSRSDHIYISTAVTVPS
jgi:hypothetical protein